MPILSTVFIAIKALKELGVKKISLYARYRLGLISGYFRLKTPRPKEIDQATLKKYDLKLFLALPDKQTLIKLLGEQGIAQLLEEADEITTSKVRLFGGEPVDLCLSPQLPRLHWTQYEHNTENTNASDDDKRDIRWQWEPARFGWAYILARAYHLTHNEKYCEAFWEFTETFIRDNPAYFGYNWVSAQEVALRLIALVFAWNIFAASPSSTSQRKEKLVQSIICHAVRIPPTLVYARAQDNNHLLSEAAGLFTASLVLPDHPQARHWRKLGWYWFTTGLQRQISPNGTYIQHSTNYHRLMLQLVLWMNLLAQASSMQFPNVLLSRLQAAMRWLLVMTEPTSGMVPNLGPNDGANIQPLSVCPHHDYRPTIQAAAWLFFGKPAFAPGIWDEMSYWLAIKYEPGSLINTEHVAEKAPTETERSIIKSTGGKLWAYLRAVRFSSRPGHADQLHLDIWWKGLNVAQDAGTYRYNAASPWDNSLATTHVHNTLVINDKNQMIRAGRFLWVDWAQAQILKRELDSFDRCYRLVTRHDGYRKFNLIHQRTVSIVSDDTLKVIDELLPIDSRKITSFNAQSNWLIPDWDLEQIQDCDFGSTLQIKSPWGIITLEMCIDQVEEREDLPFKVGLTIVRAGNLVHGSGNTSPIHGWVSDTYGYKNPAKSIRLAIGGNPPIKIMTTWHFPQDS